MVAQYADGPGAKHPGFALRLCLGKGFFVLTGRQVAFEGTLQHSQRQNITISHNGKRMKRIGLVAQSSLGPESPALLWLRSK